VRIGEGGAAVPDEGERLQPPAADTGALLELLTTLAATSSPSARSACAARVAERAAVAAPSAARKFAYGLSATRAVVRALASVEGAPKRSEPREAVPPRGSDCVAMYGDELAVTGDLAVPLLDPPPDADDSAARGLESWSKSVICTESPARLAGRFVTCMNSPLGFPVRESGDDDRR
jgi:hypothetical protein